MSWTRMSRTPPSIARPSRLSRRGPSRMPGKIVNTSMRIARRLLGCGETRNLSDDDPPRRDVDPDDHAGYHGDQRLRFGGVEHRPDVVGRRVDHVPYGPERPATIRLDLASDDLVIPPRAIGELGRGGLGHHQELAPERLGLLTVGDPVEAHQQPIAVSPRGPRGERAATLGPYGRAGIETPRDLGDDEDRDLTVDAVRSRDAADRDGRLLHAFPPGVSRRSRPRCDGSPTAYRPPSSPFGSHGPSGRRGRSPCPCRRDRRAG